MSTQELLAIAIALLACAFDLAKRRIPNALTFGGALAALVLALATGGFSAFGWGVAGWGLTLLLWLPIYALGGLGAGDVKLMAAIGACLGPAGAVWASLYAAIAGGALGAAVAVAQRCVRQTFSNIYLLLMHWRVAGFAPHAQLTLATATSPRLAYAVPMSVGTVVAIWLA